MISHSQPVRTDASAYVVMRATCNIHPIVRVEASSAPYVALEQEWTASAYAGTRVMTYGVVLSAPRLLADVDRSRWRRAGSPPLTGAPIRRLLYAQREMTQAERYYEFGSPVGTAVYPEGSATAAAGTIMQVMQWPGTPPRRRRWLLTILSTMGVVEGSAHGRRFVISDSNVVLRAAVSPDDGILESASEVSLAIRGRSRVIRQVAWRRGLVRLPIQATSSATWTDLGLVPARAMCVPGQTARQEVQLPWGGSPQPG